MITIQGKEFRNFAEQVNKNKEDIALIDKPSVVVSGDCKAYLVLITGEAQTTGYQYYGYTIVYLPPQTADRYESEQKLPSHIQLTYIENVIGGGINERTSIFSYDFTTSELRDMLTSPSLILDATTIHYEEITESV